MYTDDFSALRTLYASGEQGEHYEGVSLFRRTFQSTTWNNVYHGRPRGAADTGAHFQLDRQSTENHRFPYFVIRPTPGSGKRSDGAILLFHGLNEKTWEKYLPWAKSLAEQTGKAVILFPIAFHMERADREWSNPRKMMPVAQQRQLTYGAKDSSFANAALSVRLQEAPERFLLSGLQTYFDVQQLVGNIRDGKDPDVVPAAHVDLFGYSIGAFLTEILLLENPNGLFSSSRGFLFCGGATLGGMQPASRYILDSPAAHALRTYFTDDFRRKAEAHPRLQWIFERLRSVATLFVSMLEDSGLREYRSSRLAAVGRRLSAVALRRDRVMPPESVASTLSLQAQSAALHAPRVNVRDFPFEYSHVTPFPIVHTIREEVDVAFRDVFRLAAAHLA